MPKELFSQSQVGMFGVLGVIGAGEAVNLLASWLSRKASIFFTLSNTQLQSSF